MTRSFGRFLRQNTIALLALFVALSGTAFAAANVVVPKNSVGTKQLKKNAVTSVKIKNNQVTGADVRESSLGMVPNASHATSADSATNATNATNAINAINAATAGSAAPSGAAGGDLTGSYPNPTVGDGAITKAKIAAGAVAAAQLATITEVAATSATVANGGTAGVTATCPAGTQVISGGFDPGNNALAWRVQRSHRDGNGWRAFGTNQTGVNSFMVAKAYCLQS